MTVWSPAVRFVRHPQALWECLDGEVVAWNPGASALHHLSNTASAFFLRLDGDADVGVLAEQLAADFSAPVAVVQSALNTLAVELLYLDLIQEAQGP